MRLAETVLVVRLAGVGMVGGPARLHAADDAELSKLRTELEQLRGRLSSQSHAMMDVGYHFSNL